MVLGWLTLIFLLVLALPYKGKGYTFSKAARESMIRKRKETLRERRHKTAVDEDDPFSEDYGMYEEEKSSEQLARERYELRQMRALEKQERSRVHSIVMEAGGLRTRDDLREEYSEIPNTFKRRDGLPGDEMADYFKEYYPELGIEDERDLIDFLAS